MAPPTGLLLVGPPGTGKTMVARLIATQTRRSFYPVTPADMLGAGVGDSVKRLREVFQRAHERAHEHAPSIVFLDEIDGLLPANQGLLSGHDTQLVEQTLIEMSALGPGSEVFILGATNHPGSIEPRVLRGGRISERLMLALPNADVLRRLLRAALDGVALAPPLNLDRVAGMLEGHSPANLQAIVMAAKRRAWSRTPDGSPTLAPLEEHDFFAAICQRPAC